MLLDVVFAAAGVGFISIIDVIGSVVAVIVAGDVVAVIGIVDVAALAAIVVGVIGAPLL